MVEIEDPYVSGVSAHYFHYLEPLFFFRFSNAPIQKIDSILNKFKEILDKVSNEERIDTQRMRLIIDKTFLEALSALENDPQETLARILISDSIYGTNEYDVSILKLL